MTQYNLAYPYPPGYTPAISVNPPHALDLEYYHPHHLDLPPAMKEIPDAPPTQCTSCPGLQKVGVVYITVLGLVNQVMPHTGSWHPLATAVNYLVQIAPIVYMAFQAWPSSPTGVQLDSGIGCDTERLFLVNLGASVL
ncbi:hypothetical protein DSO57_1026080 [Entomophthora muscae]|uniref:Uncharacterized protein n=1 Tax=Entomophthora muscae TaxID=34485 RepID=A0ACC2UN31_9FUNG|nr:hypothetical protein DSO57_1026080 [Entomophthora muscae]